jgi:hypothetical protein
MITYDIAKASHFDRRVDGELTYKDWCGKAGIDFIEFPFVAESNKFHKNRRITFKVQTWGCYQAADGRWIVFVAYQYTGMKHTVQYRWWCDENGRASGEAAKFEWIN